MVNLKGRDFLKLLDFTSEEIEYLVDLAADLKAKKKAGIPHRIHEGKNVALIFEKTSTRTRCSFEVGANDLGMGSTYLAEGSQIGKKESIADTARVLSGMFDGIEYRGYGQDLVEELAKYASVPVWNGLTNEFHPTQILADFLTIKEQFGHLAGSWRGKKPLQRNAVIALANYRDRTAIPELLRMIEQDPRPVLRGTAAWAIAEIVREPNPEMLAFFSERLIIETDEETKAEMEKAYLKMLEIQKTD